MFSGLVNLLFGSNTNTPNNPDSTNRIEGNSLETGSVNTIEATAIGRTDNNYQTVSKKSIDDHRKHLTSIDNNDDVDNDEQTDDDDDWLLVSREDDEEGSLPRTDSEEELPFVEIKRSPTFQQRPRNSHHHSLSAYHQRALALRYDDGGVTQSLYAVPSTADIIGGNSFNNLPANICMEESWFLTPPPCFTSTGPVNMETSPFENLLIEHPSMSVYHSIRSAQEAAESFVNLDLGVEESHNGARTIAEQQTVRNMSKPHRVTKNRAERLGNTQPIVRNKPVPHRAAKNRAERLDSTQCKMEYLAHTTQKTHMKRENQTITRGAIKRANKVREYNSKGNCPRRSDMQHSNVISRANNNRKC